MGVGYYEPITQWSKGEYAGANNTQDDFAVMRSNGLLPVADDYPERSPAPLAPGVPRTGIVSSRSDVDAFAITIATATTVTVTATPAAVSPDLDISLTLSKGKETIALRGPAVGVRLHRRRGRASMPASPPPCRLARTPLLDGVGAGNPLDTGYSDYASVGAYTVTFTTTGT